MCSCSVLEDVRLIYSTGYSVSKAYTKMSYDNSAARLLLRSEQVLVITIGPQWPSVHKDRSHVGVLISLHLKMIKPFSCVTHVNII